MRRAYTQSFPFAPSFPVSSLSREWRFWYGKTNMAALLETDNLKKHYRMGDTTVRIFQSFNLVSTMSALEGSYPASRAARLDPIQALRHD